MFDDFNITKYKHKKFPADFSLKTLGEIKQLQSTPVNSFYANKYDNINNVFKKIFENRKRIYPEPLVQELISKSQPLILKLKNYHGRKRPYILSKNYNIDLNYAELKSAKTPSYPSGHSTQAKLVSLVLSDIFPEMKPEFDKAIDHISQSRIVARVHYESDKKFGEELGQALYSHFKNTQNK
jgi:hypothetical protein